MEATWQRQDASGLDGWLGVYSPPDYDIPYSWSEECENWAAPRDECNEQHTPLCTKGDDPAASYEDGLHVERALALMRNHSVAEGDERRFFLMVGLRRPHLPWVVPPAYIDAQLPVNETRLAAHQNAPLGAPHVAWWDCLNEPPFQAAMPLDASMTRTSPLPASLQRDARRAYYAAASFTDALFGELLDGLAALGRADETLVVFHSDHGWQLGEHGIWCKETNYELGVRVPLLVRAPWAAPGSFGRVTGRIVELVDMYRTTVELAGLDSRAVQAGVDGRSFAATVVAGDAEGGLQPDGAAFSQYPRCFENPEYPSVDGDMAVCTLSGEANAVIAVMGYTVRTLSWRYTEWWPWDSNTTRPITNGTLPSDRELYSHAGDDGTDPDAFENVNSAYDAAYQREVEELSCLLSAGFGWWRRSC